MPRERHAKPGGNADIPPRVLIERPGLFFGARLQDRAGMTMTFEKVQGRYNGPQLETEVLEFWRQHDVFARSLAASKNKPRFSFNEGNPKEN